MGSLWRGDDFFGSSIYTGHGILRTIEAYCPKCGTRTLQALKTEGAWEVVICLGCGKEKWF